VVAAVERRAVQVRRPGSPDREYVAVEVREIVPGRPDDEGGAEDPPPGGAVGVVMRAVDP